METQEAASRSVENSIYDLGNGGIAIAEATIAKLQEVIAGLQEDNQFLRKAHEEDTAQLEQHRNKLKQLEHQLEELLKAVYRKEYSHRVERRVLLRIVVRAKNLCMSMDRDRDDPNVYKLPKDEVNLLLDELVDYRQRFIRERGRYVK